MKYWLYFGGDKIIIIHNIDFRLVMVCFLNVYYLTVFMHIYK